MQSGIEKRVYPRKLLEAKVIFEDEFGEGLFYLYSSDISLGGLFIPSDIPIKEGSYVFLSFTLPGDRRVRATAEVVRVRRVSSEKSGGTREGIGLRFVGLSREALKVIEEFTS